MIGRPMLSEPQWARIFGAAKSRGAKWRDLADVNAFKREIDAALNDNAEIVVVAPRAADGERRIGPRGLKLMHEFEGCRLEAYPDPGSRDGYPWTIGWGSTGPGIGPGVVWTQEQADARFADDLLTKYGRALNKMLEGVPTTQNQYDAMLALIYNIGIAGFRGSTVLRKHKAKDYLGAARAFLMWNKNDGKVMRGLTRRRLAESELYSS